MRKILYIAKFTKGGQEVFHTYMYSGYNGYLTGFKNNSFSISLNARRPSYSENILMLGFNLILSWNNYKQSTKLIRYALEECDNFNCAIELIKNTPTSTPVYFTVAGT